MPATLPDWSFLPDGLRARVQQQEPERQRLWAELREQTETPEEFLGLLQLRLDNDDIAAAVSGSAPLSAEEKAMSDDDFYSHIVMTSQENHQAATRGR